MLILSRRVQVATCSCCTAPYHFSIISSFCSFNLCRDCSHKSKMPRWKARKHSTNCQLSKCNCHAPFSCSINFQTTGSSHYFLIFVTVNLSAIYSILYSMADCQFACQWFSAHVFVRHSCNCKFTYCIKES